MKQIIFITCVFFSFLTFANAGELYRCTDRSGNEIITSTPQDGMENCMLKDSYEDATPQQKAQWEREKLYRQSREASVSQSKSRKELEKKYLEAKKSGSSGAFVDAVDERIKELENDEDQYFYNKEQREKAAASTPPQQHGVVISPTTGRVVGTY